MIIILENKKMNDNDKNINKIDNKENFIGSEKVESSKNMNEKGKKIKYSDIISAINHNNSIKNDNSNYKNNYSSNKNEEFGDHVLKFDDYIRFINNTTHYKLKNDKNFEKSIDLIVNKCNSYCKNFEIYDSCYNNCFIKGLYAFSNLIYRRKLFEINNL